MFQRPRELIGVTRVDEPELRELVGHMQDEHEIKRIVAAPTVAMSNELRDSLLDNWVRVKKVLCRRSNDLDDNGELKWPKLPHPKAWFEQPNPDPKKELINRVFMDGNALKGVQPGAEHGHETDYFYKGEENGEHIFHYKTRRTHEKAGDDTTVMQGIMILRPDDTMVNMVFDNDEKSTDLPKDFREVSVWWRKSWVRNTLG